MGLIGLISKCKLGCVLGGSREEFIFKNFLICRKYLYSADAKPLLVCLKNLYLD